MNRELPIAFVQRMRTYLQDDADAFFGILDTDAVTSLRVNPQKQFAIPTNWKSVPWCKYGFYLPERPSFVADPLFHAGAYYVQEASSMMLAQMLDMRPNMRILDLCGAPGGKSTLLASYLEDDSFLVANEVIHARAKILAENLTRWGHPNTIVTQNDPADFGRHLGEYFDLIVVDAPCSGEGMFRKEQESRGEWSEENVQLCSARQRRILGDIIPALAPGGQVIYSTCTYAPSENEEVVEWLLDTFEELELYSLEGLEKFGAEPVKIADNEYGGYRCMPHKMKGEGLFICRLKKKGEKAIKEKIRPRKKRKQQKQKKLGAPDKIVAEFFNTYINQIDIPFTIFDDLLLLQLKHLQTFPFKKFKTLKKGMLAGKIHRKGINPTHELALGNFIKDHLPAISLTKTEAQTYLQKQDLQLSRELPIHHGWLLARYEGVNLGWLKAVNGRLKNHFPTNWRIRTSL